MENGYIKVGSATPKIKVADTIYNYKSIVKEIDKANNEKVKLLVLPELCITGYTSGDLFYNEVLLNGAKEALDNILSYTKEYDIVIAVGMPFRADSLIYNTAVIIYKGEILGIVPKKFLPNYNEFYEKRYFVSAPEKTTTILYKDKQIPFGTKIIFKAKKIEGFTFSAEICEDLWSVTPPSCLSSINGANIIINLSCSDETIGKAEYRKNLVVGQSARLVSGYIYADSGEGESTTDMVFSGHNIIAENGKLLKETKLFDNSLISSEIDVKSIEFERSKLFNHNYPKDSEFIAVYFDMDKEKTHISRTYPKYPFVPNGEDERLSRSSLILRMQAEGLKKRVESAYAKKLVIGLSGGLDSTLALLVAVRVMSLLNRDNKEIIGVTMPCFGTTSRTYNNTVMLAKQLKITLKTVSIEKAVIRHLKDLKHPLDLYDVTYENAQARERTQVLMDTANMYNGLVVGTGDLSELALGWATYNGDHMSMYAVNAGVPKTLVRYIIDYYAKSSKPKLKSILKDILDTPVSPELLPSKNDKISQKTEDIIGPYILHDFYLFYIIRMGFSPKKTFMIAKDTFCDEFDNETLKKWLVNFVKRFFAQQFKRSCLPDGVKIGSVTLSPRGDWRMPSDASRELFIREAENIEF